MARERAADGDPRAGERVEPGHGQPGLAIRHDDAIRDVGWQPIRRLAVRLHAERVVDERQHGEMVDRFDGVDQIVIVVARGQRVPRRVGDRGAEVELVGHPQQRSLLGIPGGSLRALSDATSLRFCQAGVACARGMGGPERLAAGQPGRPQDQGAPGAGP